MNSFFFFRCTSVLFIFIQSIKKFITQRNKNSCWIRYIEAYLLNYQQIVFFTGMIFARKIHFGELKKYTRHFRVGG